MKKFNLLIYMVLVAGLSFGQTLSKGVIAGAGGSNSVSGNSITWILGQVITGTGTSSEGTLSQGFLTGNITVQEITTSVESLYKTDINVYPNPTVAEVIVETNFEFNSESGKLFFTILDMQGKKLQAREIKADNEKIDLSDYPAGIYFIKITNEQQSVKTFKIDKQ